MSYTIADWPVNQEGPNFFSAMHLAANSMEKNRLMQDHVVLEAGALTLWRLVFSAHRLSVPFEALGRNESSL